MSRFIVPCTGLRINIGYYLAELGDYRNYIARAQHVLQLKYLEDHSILVDIGRNIKQVRAMHHEINGVLERILSTVDKGTRKGRLKRCKLMDKVDDFAIIQASTIDTMDVSDYLKLLDELNFISITDCADYQKLIKALLRNKVIMRGLRNTDSTDDNNCFVVRLQIPDELMNSIRKVVGDIPLHILSCMIDFIWVLAKYGFNEYSLCVILNNYVSALLPKYNKIIADLNDQFQTSQYIEDINQKIEELSFDAVVEEERKQRSLNFLCKKKYKDVVRTIELLIKINPQLESFKTSFLQSYPQDYQEIIKILNNNELFQRMRSNYHIEDNEVPDLIDLFHHYYYYSHVNWSSYFTGMLINLGIGWDSLSLQAMIYADSPAAISYYLIHNDKIECNNELIGSFIYMLINRVNDKTLPLFELFLSKLPLTKQHVRYLLNSYDVLRCHKLNKHCHAIKKFLYHYFYLEVENVNIIDFIVSLWKIFPNDRAIPLYTMLDLDTPKQCRLTLDDIQKLLEKNPKILVINRLGNKSLNFFLDMEQFYRGRLNFASIIYSYFDKFGYQFNNIRRFEDSLYHALMAE